MKQILILVIVATLSGCANTNWKVGLAAHPRGMDAPEYNTKSPVGLVRGETQFNDYWSGFFEHESMIFHIESGYGYNKAGVMLDITKVFQRYGESKTPKKSWYETK